MANPFFAQQKAKEKPQPEYEQNLEGTISAPEEYFVAVENHLEKMKKSIDNSDGTQNTVLQELVALSDQTTAILDKEEEMPKKNPFVGVGGSTIILTQDDFNNLTKGEFIDVSLLGARGWGERTSYTKYGERTGSGLDKEPRSTVVVPSGRLDYKSNLSAASKEAGLKGHMYLEKEFDKTVERYRSYGGPTTRNDKEDIAHGLTGSGKADFSGYSGKQFDEDGKGTYYDKTTTQMDKIGEKVAEAHKITDPDDKEQVKNYAQNSKDEFMSRIINERYDTTFDNRHHSSMEKGVTMYNDHYKFTDAEKDAAGRSFGGGGGETGHRCIFNQYGGGGCG